MKTTVSSKGQIVLPADLRRQDRIVAGHAFSIQRLNAGEYLLRKLPTPGRSGLWEWLAACPEKDWFQPIASESTRDL